LMAGVTWQLRREVIVDVRTALLALLAAVPLLRFRVNSAWVVLGGAVLGLGLRPLVI
jgi:chromate transporter